MPDGAQSPTKNNTAQTQDRELLEAMLHRNARYGAWMMDRRRFLLASLAGALVAPLAAEAQQTGKVWKIGFLGPSPSGTAPHLVQAFRQGLREVGYVEGK